MKSPKRIIGGRGGPQLAFMRYLEDTEATVNFEMGQAVFMKYSPEIRQLQRALPDRHLLAPSADYAVQTWTPPCEDPNMRRLMHKSDSVDTERGNAGVSNELAANGKAAKKSKTKAKAVTSAAARRGDALVNEVVSDQN